MSDQNLRGTKVDDYFWELVEDPEPIVITNVTRYLQCYKSDIYPLAFVYYDTNLQVHTFEDVKNIKLSGYDKSIIKIKDMKIYPQSVGETEITVKYGKFTSIIKVKVRPADFIIGDTNPTIESFEPVSSVYNVTLSKHKKQIRAFVTFSNGTWGEGYNDSVEDHAGFAPKVERNNYPITYEVADEEICHVNARGIITAKKEGTTTVKVSTIDGFSFEVTVNVENDK